MQRTVTIFRKELKDILRDRRTLIMMVLVPMLIMPLLIIGLNKLQSSVMEKAQEKELRIGFLGSDYAPDLMNLFQEQERMILLPDFPPDSLRPSISGGELDGAVIIPKSFGKSLKEDAQGEVQIVYKGSEGLGVVKDRLIKVIEEYDRLIVTERVERLNLDPNLFDAVTITELDVSSKQEVIGKLVGGFLPYMFVIFSFMGAMYPGIDLGAGEKERGSLETLLSSPATRLEIVLGKLGVVSLAGIASALIAMLGMSLAVRFITDTSPEILDAVMSMLDVKMILLILSLVIPLAVFFAAGVLSISIYARSFKEAQSMISPASILIIIPVAIGLLPGIELSPQTAFIPVLNVSLATKEVLAGTADLLLLLEVYVSLLIFSGLGIWGCVRWFNREETLFRS
jgi:sodium transport system permease protein